MLLQETLRPEEMLVEAPERLRKVGLADVSLKLLQGAGTLVNLVQLVDEFVQRIQDISGRPARRGVWPAQSRSGLHQDPRVVKPHGTDRRQALRVESTQRGQQALGDLVRVLG